jgi:hypothetical protein
VDAERERSAVESRLAAQRLEASTEADVRRIKTESEVEALAQREKTAVAYKEHASLLRMFELETLRQLAGSANARIYVDFNDKRRHEE